MKAFSRWSVGSLAFVIILVTGVSQAQAVSSTWSPTGVKITLSATAISFTTPGGFISNTCNIASIGATITAVAGSSWSTAGASVTFINCSATGGAVGAWATAGTWGMTLSDATTVGAGGGATPTCNKSATVDSCAVTIHVGGVTIVVTPPIFADCSLTISAQSMAGIFTDLNTSLVINDNTITYTSTGGVCGASAATANFTATYTSTAITVTAV